MKLAIDKCLCMLGEVCIHRRNELIEEEELKKMIKLNLGGSEATVNNYLDMAKDFAVYENGKYDFKVEDIKRTIENRFEVTKDSKMYSVLERLGV